MGKRSNFELHCGKSEEVLKEYPDNHFDSIVTDPPYHLTSIVKRFGASNSAPAQFGTDGAFARASRGFMGKEWDGGDIAFRPEFWAEVLRVLKPGGHLLAFSGSRTYHRMACGIEDAGFEIRDSIMWLYGSGFPKSHDVSKGIDKMMGAEREVIGCAKGAGTKDPDSFGNGHNPKYDLTAPATDAAKQWQGWGSALKPAHEPICVARKPLIGTIAENVLQYGTGALNVDGCRIPLNGEKTNRSLTDPTGWKNTSKQVGSITDDWMKGRWPANVIHDGLEEEWARFFYCAKASKKDRDEGLDGFEPDTIGDGRPVAIDNAYQRGKTERQNTHPTVKPCDLMRYLCHLVTPPGGLVLDPFMGSGSTGKAAMKEGFNFVGIDMTPEYVEIARARIKHSADMSVVINIKSEEQKSSEQVTEEKEKQLEMLL